MIICRLTKVDWKPSLMYSLSLSLSHSLLVRSHPSLVVIIIVGLISRRVVSFHLLVVRRVSGADDAETRMLHPVPWSRSLSVVLVSKAQHNFSFEDHRTEMLDLSRTLH